MIEEERGDASEAAGVGGRTEMGYMKAARVGEGRDSSMFDGLSQRGRARDIVVS